MFFRRARHWSGKRPRRYHNGIRALMHRSRTRIKLVIVLSVVGLIVVAVTMFDVAGGAARVQRLVRARRHAGHTSANVAPASRRSFEGSKQ